MEVDEEKPPPTRSCNGAKFVSKYLKLPNKNALFKLIQLPSIKEVFEEFEKNVIKPQVAKAKAAGKNQRPRLMNFKVVEALIHSDEAGPRNFTSRRVNKTGWKLLDHYAYAVVSLVLDFKSEMDGPLRSRQVSERMEKNMAWALLKFMSYQETPSRRKLRLQAEAKKEAARQKREAEEAAQRSEGGQNRKNRKRKRRAGATTASSSDSNAEDDSDNAEPVRSNLVLPEILIPAGPTDEEIEQDHQHIEALLPETLDEDLDLEAETLLNETLTRYNIPPAVQHAVRDPETSSLSVLDTMLAERQHDTLNLTDRFWKDVFITTILANYDAPVNTERTIQRMETTIQDFEDATWQRALHAAEEDDFDIFGLSTTTDEDQERYKQNAKLFDNKRYQNELANKACHDLGISTRSRRFDEMPATASFKFWQPVAIYAMREFERRGLQGSILGDLMGLGKTWEMLGCFLAVSSLFIMFS